MDSFNRSQNIRRLPNDFNTFEANSFYAQMSTMLYSAFKPDSIHAGTGIPVYKDHVNCTNDANTVPALNSLPTSKPCARSHFAIENKQ